MSHSLQRFLLFFALATAWLGAAAGNISGTVTDNEGESLPRASVRLLAAADSSMVSSTIADDEGRFALGNIKRGKYVVEISFVGFAPYYTDVAVKSDQSAVDLGVVRLTDDTIMLREAVVRGVHTPIKVKEDTIEYAADAYRTAPNAVVEDLLRRLPGVEVGNDGKITVNGKEVSKILIDGQEFFSDDPTVASRNIPVDMVDRLQVVDRKSDLARITGVDDGEEETVINLAVKKGMRNGWFGNVEGGYGTDGRYKGSMIANRFQNSNQFTVLGGANNINEPAFTDGGMGRFMRFGGMNGVTASQALGINFNVGNGEIFRVGGDVMWSRSDQDTRTSSDRQYLLPGESSFVNSARNARDIGNNLRGDFRMMWKPDSSNTLEFRPNFSYNHNHSWSSETSLTSANDRSPVTQSINRDNSRGNAWSFGGRLIYNHSVKSHPGRSFSVFVNYRLSDTREADSTFSWNKFFLLGGSIDLYDQYADNHTWSNNISSRVSWTEPLGDAAKGHFLTLSYNFSYRWNNADKLTYDYPVEWPGGWDSDPMIGNEGVLNESLSNQFRNDYMNQDIRLGYKHVSKLSNLEAGLSLVPQMSRSINLMDDARSIPTRHVLNVAPFLRYRLRWSAQRSLNIHYRGRSQQPSMAQLQPVEDKSNPMSIIQGNPNLAPSFTHTVQLRFQDFNADAQRSIMAMVFANMTQNSIVSRTEFNPSTGGQRTTYENVNGVWSVRGMTMLSLPLRNRDFTISNHLMLSYANNVGFNNGLRNRSGSTMLAESIGLSWRPDNAQIEIRPLYNLQYVKNTLQSAADRTVHTYGGRFDGTWYTPIGIVLNTDLTYSATSGYSAGYDTKQWMWNASIAYQFMRNKQATITLKAYDLLQQRSNVRRTVTANYIDDSLYNSLTRYVMVTFSYRFNTFGQGNEPSTRREGFGPGGMPGPPPGVAGRGPMGPPRF